MEEIVINEEIEEVEKIHYVQRFNFPAATFGKNTIYFNKAASDIVPRFIKWGTTSEYVVGLPGKEMARNVFAVRPYRQNCKGRVAAFPRELRREKKIREGNYRLYKYKNGIAFKRYEQIGEEK